MREELSVADNLILRGDRIAVPLFLPPATRGTCIDLEALCSSVDGPDVELQGASTQLAVKLVANKPFRPACDAKGASASALRGERETKAWWSVRSVTCRPHKYVFQCSHAQTHASASCFPLRIFIWQVKAFAKQRQQFETCVRRLAGEQHPVHSLERHWTLPAEGSNKKSADLWWMRAGTRFWRN